MNFEGKNIVVIGGSSGIGKATALSLADKGAIVTIVGRDAVRINETLNYLKTNFSDKAHLGFLFDLKNIKAIKSLVLSLGNIDGLVYSAGIQKISPLKYIDESDFEEVQFVNSFAPFFVIRELIRSKKINNGASIVLVSSISGTRIGAKGLISYSTSKSALIGMSKSMALELAKQRIRVNTVLPGMIKGTLLNNTHSFSEEQLKEDKKKYPLGDYGTCEDVANGIAFLLSDLSKYITGAELVIDGGLTLN